MKEKLRKYNKLYKRKQRAVVRLKRGPYNKHKTKKEKMSAMRKSASEYNRKIRLLVLQHYSGMTPFCVCCGEKEIKFLSIDHINGGGNKHRKTLTKSGRGGNMSMWLFRNGFPGGFQILCHNCNMAKGFYGRCPHKDLTFG